ncbi:MAG: DUF6057 family protein [Bacteroidota bacterium]
MDQKVSKIVFGILPGVYLVFAFLYIIIITKPVFYFHHVQAPFVFDTGYLKGFFACPGGVSELLANFFMQSFHYKIVGPVIFMGIVLANMWLIHRLMNTIYSHEVNVVWAMAPLGFAVVLTNNYNFPFSVIISMVLVLIMLLLLAKKGNSPTSRLICYTAGALTIYYVSGSGYMMLFSTTALFLSIKLKDWRSLIVAIYIACFAFLIPLWGAGSVFPIPADQKYLFFFHTRLYFMAYEPSLIFYLYLGSVLVLPGIVLLMSGNQNNRTRPDQRGPLKMYTAVAYVSVIALTMSGHFITYRSDARKTVASDYYCFINNAGKSARAAKSLKDYNFAANLNYNLAISKAGLLTDDFFKFFQISGTDALQPDVEFASEMSFIATDFYYNLGYISEARHWAYETLVFYPYSPRILQMLVKIHLVTHEYKAAERCLNILSKTLIDRKFTAEYRRYTADTTLISNHKEIMEKRSFVPAEKELSPFIDQRLQELLEANHENKRAYEFLMIYYLLDVQLEKFMVLYEDAGNYFDKTVAIFEEAVLMYGEKYQIPVKSLYNITPVTLARYNDFNEVLQQHEGNKKLARNFLYWEMGDSYLYYLHFLYPRIVKPEIVTDENGEPTI